jgi:hypothetical protein
MAYESKRFTPRKSATPGAASGAKGSSSGSKTGDSNSDSKTPVSSGRYTPRATPVATTATRGADESPAWVAWLMFALFGIGLLIIVINYTNIWWDANNWALVAGLVAIVLGFITATRLK